MRVDLALLCDAVTVREGLMNILGGGVTRLNREVFPSQFSGGLALRILLNQMEAGTEHNLEIIFQSEDGQRLTEIKADFQSEVAQPLNPGEELSFPIGIAFQTAIPKPGAYSFEIAINGEHRKAVSLWAIQVGQAHHE